MASAWEPIRAVSRRMTVTALSRLMVALVALIALPGCTAIGSKGATMADCVKGFHHPSGDTSRCVQDPVGSPSSRPTLLPGPTAGLPSVPAELRGACGRPRTRVAVRTAPFSVATAQCDLTGVQLDYEGMSVNVPALGDASESAHADGLRGSTTTTVTASQRGGTIRFTVTRTSG